MKEIDPAKKFSGIVMFDGALNLQLGGIVLKVHYQKLTVTTFSKKCPVFLDSKGNLRGQKPKKTQTKRVNITGIQYFCAY